LRELGRVYAKVRGAQARQMSLQIRMISARQFPFNCSCSCKDLLVRIALKRHQEKG
jgi:hypothetical protein